VRSYGPRWHVTELAVHGSLVRVTLTTQHGEEVHVRVVKGQEPRLGDRFRVTFEPYEETTS